MTDAAVDEPNGESEKASFRYARASYKYAECDGLTKARPSTAS